MGRILQRPRATHDLIQIWSYIAQHNEAAADRTLAELERVIGLVSDFPLMGRNRQELHAGLRSFVSGNYVLYWVPVGGGIELFRVIHGARLIAADEFG